MIKYTFYYDFLSIYMWTLAMLIGIYYKKKFYFYYKVFVFSTNLFHSSFTFVFLWFFCGLNVHFIQSILHYNLFRIGIESTLYLL